MASPIDLSPADAAAAVANGGWLLDVRGDDEWDAGHAAAAVHIALAELADHLHEVPRDRTIVCVCRSGGRSARAAEFLADAGHDTRNLAGGMEAWVAAGLPIVNDHGDPRIL